jgi:hypothetical protein
VAFSDKKKDCGNVDERNVWSNLQELNTVYSELPMLIKSKGSMKNTDNPNFRYGRETMMITGYKNLNRIS